MNDIAPETARPKAQYCPPPPPELLSDLALMVSVLPSFEVEHGREQVVARVLARASAMRLGTSRYRIGLLAIATLCLAAVSHEDRAAEDRRHATGSAPT